MRFLKNIVVDSEPPQSADVLWVNPSHSSGMGILVCEGGEWHDLGENMSEDIQDIGSGLSTLAQIVNNSEDSSVADFTESHPMLLIPFQEDDSVFYDVYIYDLEGFISEALALQGSVPIKASMALATMDENTPVIAGTMTSVLYPTLSYNIPSGETDTSIYSMDINSSPLAWYPNLNFKISSSEVGIFMNNAQSIDMMASDWDTYPNVPTFDENPSGGDSGGNSGGSGGPEEEGFQPEQP